MKWKVKEQEEFALLERWSYALVKGKLLFTDYLVVMAEKWSERDYLQSICPTVIEQCNGQMGAENEYIRLH